MSPGKMQERSWRLLLFPGDRSGGIARAGRRRFPKGGDASPAPGRVGSVTRRRAGSPRSGGGICRRRYGTDRHLVLGAAFAASQGVDDPLGGFGYGGRFDDLPAHEALEPWFRISGRLRLLHEFHKLSCRHSGQAGQFCSFRSGGKGGAACHASPAWNPESGDTGQATPAAKRKRESDRRPNSLNLLAPRDGLEPPT